MTHLTPNHRIRIPNGLAILAALLLLTSSVVGYESSLDVHSADANMAPSSNVESAEKDSITDTAQQKRRGLNLGLLLFRR